MWAWHCKGCPGFSGHILSFSLRMNNPSVPEPPLSTKESCSSWARYCFTEFILLKRQNGILDEIMLYECSWHGALVGVIAKIYQWNFWLTSLPAEIITYRDPGSQHSLLVEVVSKTEYRCLESKGWKRQVLCSPFALKKPIQNKSLRNPSDVNVALSPCYLNYFNV